MLAADAATLFVEGARSVLRDAPQLGLDALRRAVRDWMAEKSYGSAVEAVTGKVYFDGEGNRVRSAFLARLQGGRIVSTPLQLRVLPRIVTDRDLPPGHNPERVVAWERRRSIEPTSCMPASRCANSARWMKRR